MRSQLTRYVLLATALAALAACGGSDDGKPAAEAAKPATTAKADQSGEKKAPLKCPAKVNASLPGPDIIGLKLGMSHAEALNIVRCHTRDEGFTSMPTRWFDRMQTYGIELGPQAITAMVGDTEECNFRSFNDMQRCGAGNRVWKHVAENITVATPGMPGRETVVGVWRTQRFKDGEMPAVAAVTEALVKKYGVPQEKLAMGPLHDRLAWGWDATDAPVTNPNPLFGQCVSAGAGARGQDSQSWAEGCGLNIKAMISKSRANPDLAEEISVGMLHQQNLYNYQLALEDELARVDGERRRQELEKARQSSDVQL